MNYCLQSISLNDYQPDTDYQLIAMLAVGHNSGSGVWASKTKTKQIGHWYSSQLCWDWCALAGSQEFVSTVEEYASLSSSTYITSDTAWKLWKKVYPDINYTSYTSSRINAAYPIQTIYAYIKLSMLYTQ
jgi:hypothetical protein